MALQQTSRSLLQACVRHRYGIIAPSIEAAYQQQCLLNATSSTSASLPVSQQAATSLWQLSFNGVRTFSDAPSPSDPMIIPLRNQPAPQQPHPAGPPDRNQGPWEKVQDKHTGGTYWWNTQTGLTTPVGAPKPDAWVEVVDKQSGLPYYWNQESGDTTAVGEPMPGPEGRLMTGAAAAAGGMQEDNRPSAVSVLGNSLAVGFGIGLVFGLIRMIF